MANAEQALRQLRLQHEAVRQRLIQGLPQIFNIPVEDVLEFEINPTTGIQSGILVSQGKRYEYEIGSGKKELELADGDD